MNKKIVKVIVLRTAGTNCDAETAFAFTNFGAQVDSVHINRLFNGEVRLRDYHILAIPGGFTYGDDIESGRILANELNLKLGSDLCQFIGDGKLIIGICNGFQVLVKAGILPGPLDEEEEKAHDSSQKATLTNNDSGKFEDRWTYLKREGNSVWTEGLAGVVYFPVAHAEGKFIPLHKDITNRLKQNGQVAFRYCNANAAKPIYPENPNGSTDDIAGITDQTGRILGLMPHPERHFLFTQHPFWTRLHNNGRYGQGAKIFENGVNYVIKKFL
jgi:phosphoribosylformylglycinamidine synthase